MNKKNADYLVRKIFYIFLCLFLNAAPCFSHSDDFYVGYAQSIIDDIIPEEAAQITLHQQCLIITVNGSPLNINSELNLINSLEKKSYFHQKNNY